MLNHIQNTAGIYIIKNSINENVYIGQSAHLYNRLVWHIRELKNNRHPNPKLQRFVNKYGLNCVSFDILEYCEPNKKILCDREQLYMDKYKIKFNIAKSSFSTLGVKKSADERRRMSERRKGIKLSAEHIKAASIARTGVKHSFRTKEHCEKISKAAKDA
jgi:group I intron endonuclease